MSRNYLCDLCRRDVALENQLVEVKLGEKVVAEVCFNCSSSLEKTITEQVAAVRASPMETPGPQEPTAPETKPAVEPTAPEPTPSPKAPTPAPTQPQ